MDARAVVRAYTFPMELQHGELQFCVRATRGFPGSAQTSVPSSSPPFLLMTFSKAGKLCLEHAEALLGSLDSASA